LMEIWECGVADWKLKGRPVLQW